MKRSHNVYSTLNQSFDPVSQNLYAQKKQQEQAVEEVHKKYGIGSYYSPLSQSSMYTQEFYNISTNLRTRENELINNHITITHKMDLQYYNAMEFRSKICKNANLHKKTNEFMDHLKKHEEEISKSYKEIAKCANLIEADKIGSEMTSYHDINIQDIYSKSNEVLEDFQVNLMGINPDGH